MSDLRKHARRHLLQKPLKCGHCDFEGVTNRDVTQHSRKKHKGLPISIVFNPTPPSNKTEVRTIIRRKRRTTTAAAAPSTSSGVKATPSSDDEDDVDVTTVADDPDWKMSKGGGGGTANVDGVRLGGSLKKYKCRVCEHTSDSYMYMRADHVRSHFKPFECSYCKKR